MAEKKYIGKPGKQDDPCWKGYEMVGMKKKGGRKVPNCVPEATDIIAKAKQKLATEGSKYPRKGFPKEGEYGYHPNPGMKPQESDRDEDMDKAYKTANEKEGKKPLNAQTIEVSNKVEETKLDEALTRVTSGNKGYGYHGNVEARDEEERDKRYSAMHRHAKNLLMSKGHLQDAKKPNVMVKHFLDSTHGRHIAHNPTEKEITSRFKHFAKKYDPAMHEEVELEEAENKQYIEITHQSGNRRRVPVHPLNAKRALKRYQDDPSTKSARFVDEELEEESKQQYIEVEHKLGGKKRVKVHPSKAYAALNHYRSLVHTKSARIVSESELPWDEDPKNPTRKVGERKDQYGNKIKNVAKHLAKKAMSMKEELGKDNEWGRPELRKKFAAMTPGQEGLAADKIPTFDPRYDDVTTQHLGLHPVREGYLAEISARGAEARAKFQAKIHKTLNDPAAIKRAKKTLAKKKAEDKAKEPAHLVMQLRKAVSIGSKVHFRDGSHHTIAPNHADRFMSKYNSAKSAIEKEALQKRAHASHSEFMKTIAEEVHENCGTPDCCMQCDTAEMGTHHVDSYEAHRGSGEQISPVISHDDDDIRFSDFDETEFEKELDADVHALTWEDLVDLYDDDELEYVETPEKESEDLEEAITPAGRLKKKFAAMRTKTRRNMARNLALKRVSTPDRVKARSVRAARRMVYKRLLRNRDISTVSAAEKTRLEAQIKRMAPMVARLSVRIMPKIRKLEQSRIQHARLRKKK